MEDDPRQRGLGPDGSAPETVLSSGAAQGLSVKEAVRTTRFLGLYTACLVGSLGAFVPFVHLVPYAIDHKFEPTMAVLLLGAIGVGSTIGRFFLGNFADRMGGTLSWSPCISAWRHLSRSGQWPEASRRLSCSPWLRALLRGWVAILPAVVTDHFGARRVSGIIGVLYTSVAIGTLVGPSAAGFMFDASHSYFVPIAASAIANAVASALRSSRQGAHRQSPRPTCGKATSRFVAKVLVGQIV